MSDSDLLFLFELVVEEMKSWVDLRDIAIKCLLADIFTMVVKNPFTKKVRSKRSMRYKLRHKPKDAYPVTTKTNEVESIIFEQELQTLINNMVKYPIEFSLWSKSTPSQRLATAFFPMNQEIFNFLTNVDPNKQSTPVIVHEKQNIFDEITSKRVATVKLNIKITYLKERPKVEPFPTLSNKPMKKNSLENYYTDIGTIKTIYSNKYKINKILEERKQRVRRARERSKPNKGNLKETKKKNEIDVKGIYSGDISPERTSPHKTVPYSLSKSDTQINFKNQTTVLESRSLSNFDRKDKIDLKKYIFTDIGTLLRKEIYWVNYFSVQNNSMDSPVRSKSSKSSKESPSRKSSDSCSSGPCKGKVRLKICDSQCQSRKSLDEPCSQDSCNEDDEGKPSAVLVTCKDVNCEYKDHRKPLPPPDDSIYIETNKPPCCAGGNIIEEVVGNMKAEIKIGSDEHPCYCTCECKFGFTKRTTYCGICGGYEKIGEGDLAGLRPHDLPHPCPIYHKLEKSKPAPSTDTKKRGDKKKLDKPSSVSGNTSENEKDSKKSKIKKKKDDRFKFNYGYKAPQIGHSQCAMPCTGTLGAVPRHMGWLWTSDNVPGLKFRPSWKPGAVNKHVVRLLRIAKNPEEAFAKKRRDTGKKKRPLKRPLLIIHKKDGEFTVTMETMKTFAKPRIPSQHPYEDKPLLTYTIGRTDEENRERQKKKDREKRRLERAQRRFIQSTFSDMCKDICLKTYQQALGILPFAEDPPCLCYPIDPDAEHTNLDVSCSCSEDKSITDSDTDLDEWFVEFTPPNAYFNQSQVKTKKIVKVDNGSQYTYLDYRVALFDRLGNPVPRFFTGPDGKQQCSDLGGFWSADKKWLEINVDGYIAPDRRWAPLTFFGPNGEQVDSDDGKFQAMNGNWLLIGIDGYIDNNNRWRFYPKSRQTGMKKSPVKSPVKKRGPTGDKKDIKALKPSETAFSCFGDASPKYISELGKLGHGHDRRVLLAALQNMIARGEKIQVPKPQTVPKFSRAKRRTPSPDGMKNNVFGEIKCKHPIPSSKGIVAVDTQGNKIYFRLKANKNRRPQIRLDTLKDQGISLSSFHVPCLDSFINSEEMKMKQRERLEAMALKAAYTQVP